MEKRKAIIESDSRTVFATSECGNLISARRTYCNPNALRQLILDVEMAGYHIDWTESTVAKPSEN